MHVRGRGQGTSERHRVGVVAVQLADQAGDGAPAGLRLRHRRQLHGDGAFQLNALAAAAGYGFQLSCDPTVFDRARRTMRRALLRDRFATASSGSVGSNGSMVAGYRLETLLLAERDGLDSIFRRRCHRPGDLVVVHGRGRPVVGRGTA
jgi:hypothetical protein